MSRSKALRLRAPFRSTNALRVLMAAQFSALAAMAHAQTEPSAAPPAQANTAPEPAKVEKVIVTAAPFANRDELQSVQPGVVVSRDTLARERAASLGDTLAGQTGIQSSSFGPGASRPIIRGLDGPRIKTTENGMGSADVSTISPDHAVSSETLGARQIEILRGPATLLYGSGAIGGLVNVVTDRIPQSHTERTRLIADTRFSTAERTREIGAQLRTSAGSLAFTGEFSDRKTGDVDTANSGRLANSDTASRNGSFGASLISSNGFVGVGINRFESNYGIPSPDATRIELARDRIDALGEFNDVMGLERIRFSASNNRYEHAEIESDGNVGTVFSNRSTGARLDLQTRPVSGWRTVVGADVESSKFSAVGDETIVPLTQTRSHALFAATERALGPGRIEIGARLERVVHTPEEASALPRRSFSLGNGSVGYQWQLSRDSAITASFTHAERAPAIEELYSNGAHIATLTYDVGNAALTRERSQNLDLSYKLQRGAWRVNASLFRNTVKGFVYGASVDENGDGLADHVNEEGEIEDGAELLKRQFRNVDARFTGAELSAAFAPTQGFGFAVMADTVRGVITSTNGGNLPRMSPSRIGGKLTWRGGAANAWYVDLGATHTFAQNNVASFESETAGFTRVDATARYRWTLGANRHADFYIVGKNLTNRDMRVHTSFLKDFAPLAGRSVFAGVTMAY